MIKRLPRNIIRFVVLVLVQVLIFNNIEISGNIIPYIYIIFIILLPFETPGWTVLGLGFLLGFSIDILSDTMGMHTAATTFMAFLRPKILAMVAPRDGYESGSYPRIFYYGLSWFAQYAVILVFAHHFLLFFTEALSFADTFSILLRILLSTITSTAIICISQYFIFRK